MSNIPNERSVDYQQALLLLSKNQWLAGHENLIDSIRLATEVASNTLEIQRCSVWLYEDEKKSITCMDLYERAEKRHSSGAVLDSLDFPCYFEALYTERIISADDAVTNRLTCEFRDSYLEPLGIASMLDAPIWLGGRTVGVFCCEHVGEKREWGIQEKNFAASVADFASISFELAKHKETSDALRKHKRDLESLVDVRTRELREKNEALESFGYSLSHDLRAPLRHIDGFLILLKENIAHLVNETANHYIDTSRACVTKMNLMIDSMLNLSRVSTLEMKPREVDLSRLVREIAAERAESGRKIEFRIHDTVPVKGDEGLLRIAMTNLIENACKYTRNVAKPVVEFGEDDTKGRLTFYLRDNGCGFDMQYSDKLFKVFQRLHGDSDYEGTGVGLSTVRRIIDRHGGRIWAEGTPDVGATFYFTLGDQTLGRNET